MCSAGEGNTPWTRIVPAGVVLKRSTLRRKLEMALGRMQPAQAVRRWAVVAVETSTPKHAPTLPDPPPQRSLWNYG
ncbi:hypothetical protein PSPO01_06088 [Paraphaeosphaeria sporulosa]